MNERLWKVKMVRLLTDGASPDVIVESSFEHKLPADWSEMLENLQMVDEAYHDSIFTGVYQHCINEHAKSGFYPAGLISPNSQV